jgi:hypothetical protein
VRKTVRKIGLSAIYGERKQKPRFDVSPWNYGNSMEPMEGCLLLGVQEVPSSNLGSPTKTQQVSPSIAAFSPFWIFANPAQSRKYDWSIGAVISAAIHFEHHALRRRARRQRCQQGHYPDASRYASTLFSLAFHFKRRPCLSDMLAICTTSAAWKASFMGAVGVWRVLMHSRKF